MKYSFIAHTAAAVLGAAVLAAPAVAQEYKWDMPNTFGRTSSDGVADLVFAELLKEKSGGRIQITHHFDGSLGYRGVDLLNAVQDGAVPIARHAVSYYGGFDPMFMLASQPFLIEKPDDVDTMVAVIEPAMTETFAKFNQVPVSTGLFPPSGVWSKKPINSLDDMKGLKLRAFDLNSLETFTGAGAAAVNMNWGDVLPALSTGAIEGVVTSADLGNASGLNEYLPNFLQVNWATPLSYVTINKDVWDSLPADLQQAVQEAGAEATKRTLERLRGQVAENYKQMRAKGVTVNENADPALMAKLRESAAPVLQRWREAVGDGQKVLDDYLKAAGRG
jgi:TRAP-type C4-dicarboxylate transport system substrate-binding protein